MVPLHPEQLCTRMKTAEIQPRLHGHKEQYCREKSDVLVVFTLVYLHVPQHNPRGMS